MVWALTVSPLRRKFEAFLNDVAMSAFDLAGADGQAGVHGGLIGELTGAMGEVAIACSYRSLFGHLLSGFRRP